MSTNRRSSSSPDKQNKGGGLYKAFLFWIILVLLVGLIPLKVFAGLEIGLEVIILLVLLFTLLVYDEVKELSIGSLFTFRKELSQVRETQEGLSRELTQLKLGIKLSQAVSVTTQQALPGLDLKEIVSKQTELELVKKEKEELVQEVDLQKAYIDELKSKYTNQEQLVKHLSERAIFYATEYYNYFLVPNTKNLLAWLSQKTKATLEEIYKQMEHIGIAPDNRRIALEVLFKANMIEFEEKTDELAITTLGKFFLDVKKIEYVDPKRPPTLRDFVMGMK